MQRASGTYSKIWLSFLAHLSLILYIVVVLNPGNVNIIFLFFEYFHHCITNCLSLELLSFIFPFLCSIQVPKLLNPAPSSLHSQETYDTFSRLRGLYIYYQENNITSQMVRH